MFITRLLVPLAMLLMVSCTTTRIELSAASSKTTYSAGERIEIELKIENTGDVDTAVSALVEGNIRMVSVERDGVFVPTRTVAIRPDDDLGSQMQQQLRTLAPGQSVTITWYSILDRPQSGRSLETVTYLPAARDQVSSHLVSVPGSYEVRFFYLYTGPLGTVPNVFQARSNEVALAFTVTP